MSGGGGKWVSSSSRRCRCSFASVGLGLSLSTQFSLLPTAISPLQGMAFSSFWENIFNDLDDTLKCLYLIWHPRGHFLIWRIYQLWAVQ
jgi:hypothetical protein